MKSDRTLGQKNITLLSTALVTIVGKNELINILLVVYMKNGKNNQRIYLFDNLERKKTTIDLE